MLQRRFKSFTGCWTCRAKKRKCDGSRPTCTNCITRDDECEGYGRKLVWVTQGRRDYSVHKERRFIDPKQTWGGERPHSMHDIDRLIMQCDHWATYAMDSSESHIASVPFTVFRPQAWACTRMYRNLTNYHIPDITKRFLIHHFVTVIGERLAPPMLAINPFQTIFPAEALKYIHECRTSELVALYYAVLAHAATNITQLESGNAKKMLVLANQYYNIAIKNLQQSITNETREYGPFVAAILVLMLVEIYGQHSRSWKVHLEGAWNYIWSQQASQPWIHSEIGLFSTRMILILVIGIESTVSRRLHRKLSPSTTSSTESEPLGRSVASKVALKTVDYRPGFKSERLAKDLSAFSWLADVNLFEDNVCKGLLSADDLEDVYQRTCQHLDGTVELFIDSTSDMDDITLKQRLHARARTFTKANKMAIYIHWQMQVKRVTPNFVAHHVRAVFELFRQNQKAAWGDFVLWPPFIAAVEAYEQSSISAAQEWLQTSTSVGMNSRYQIRSIVEEVWRRRSSEAERIQKDPGEVSIDWRIVMTDLKIDVLLY